MGKLENVSLKTLAGDVAADIIGSLAFAVGINVFTAPNDIAPGGVSGLATIFYSLFGLPIGLVSFLINIPLLLLGWKMLGHKFILRTLKSLAILSVIIDLTAVFLPQYTANMLLAAVFGGVGIGAGLGIIFQRGSTTGGTDIAGRILLLKFPHIRLGKILMGIDCVVVLIAAIVFQSLEAALYALVNIYVTERVLDSVLYGRNIGRITFIISEKHELITKAIVDEMERGVTLLDGKGAYTGNRKDVIVCGIPSSEFPRLKKLVLHYDENAFIMVSPTSDIIGEGFKASFENV